MCICNCLNPFFMSSLSFFKAVKQVRYLEKWLPFSKRLDTVIVR